MCLQVSKKKELDPELDPDPLFRGTDPRIWILTKMSRFPNTDGGSKPVLYYPGTEYVGPQLSAILASCNRYLLKTKERADPVAPHIDDSVGVANLLQILPQQGSSLVQR